MQVIPVFYYLARCTKNRVYEISSRNIFGAL